MFSPIVLVLALSAAPGSSLDWSAPAGCPDRDSVLDQVQRLAGPDTPTAGVRVEAKVRPAAADLSLRIELHTPSGVNRRTIHAEDCTVLAGVTALMMALAIDAVDVADRLTSVPSPPSIPPEALGIPPAEVQSAERRTAPTTRPAGREPLSAGGPSSADGPTRTPSRARSGVQGLVGTSFSFGRGIVPVLDGRVAARTGLLARFVRAELVGFHVFAQRARAPERPTAGATVAAWGAIVRAGPRWQRGALELHAMAGLETAALVARGFGVTRSTRAAGAQIALTLAPGVRWVPSPRWGLGFDVEGELALRRPAFALDAVPVVYRAGRVGLRGTIAIELRLGGGLTNRRRAGD